MSKAQIRSERRSLRLWMSVQVSASGTDANGNNFREDTDTIVINAHGGLLFLRQPVKIGSDIVLTNRATEEAQGCRVITMRESSDRGMRVGVEFVSPSPRFWGVEFPPQDWPAA